MRDASGLTVQYTRSGTLEIALDDDRRAQNLCRSATRSRREGVAARWLDASGAARAPNRSPPPARRRAADRHARVRRRARSHRRAGAAAMRAGATFALEHAGRRRSRRRAMAGIEVHTENGASIGRSRGARRRQLGGQIAIAGVAEPPTDRAGARAAAAPRVADRRSRSATSSGAPTVTSSRGSTDGCWSARRSRTRGSTNARPPPACAICSRPAARSCRSLWQASFAEVRVGLRPASPDGLPVVGESEVLPGLIYATGHYRNGVLLAPLTAALVKAIVTERSRSTARMRS